MVFENDGVVSKTAKDKVKSIAFKAKFTREQTSDNSDSRGGSDEKEEDDEDEEFNLMARNFLKGVRSSGRKHGCYNCREEGHIIGNCPKPKENKDFIVRACVTPRYLT
nr:hypothetical protein [Tanacetum cinerariifolium]